MIGELANVTRGNSEILEGLGRGVNDLVVELALDLLARNIGGPPEHLVENSSEGLQDSLGKVDVPPLFVDLLVDQLGNLSHGVKLRSVKLERLRGSAVVERDLLEGLADVNDVNGPELLLHVVGREHVHHTGKLEKKVVLEAEHGRRADDGSLGENAASDLLGTALDVRLDGPVKSAVPCEANLGGEEVGSRRRIGIVR